jgi:hypothetical protein
VEDGTYVAMSMLYDSMGHRNQKGRRRWLVRWHPAVSILESSLDLYSWNCHYDTPEAQVPSIKRPLVRGEET